MDIRIEAEKRVDAKIRFQENLFKYLIVNIILAIICNIFLHSYWLLVFVMFFWGLGVLDDFFKAYSIHNYKEKMIEKEISKMGD
jgi:hypothetical protein